LATANCATQWLASTTQSEWMAAIRHWQQSLTLLNAHMKNQQAPLASRRSLSDGHFTYNAESGAGIYRTAPPTQ
ncbi:hypothetical protein MMO67_03830, partial [Escherichia coli]|nr:hypothetical protein [Escherichia coli]